MIKEQIQECIQRILDNELGGISTNNCPRGGIEKYRYMTAYRLSKYVNFYRTHRISLDDLLISLRNYLLVFQTAVRLPIDIDITDNKYGLRIDSEGLCYATLNLPEYLNVDIIKQGFMEDYIEPKKDERYFLGVTPNIYRLTGFQRFKSIRQKLAVNGALNDARRVYSISFFANRWRKEFNYTNYGVSKKGWTDHHCCTNCIISNGSS